MIFKKINFLIGGLAFITAFFVFLSPAMAVSGKSGNLAEKLSGRILLQVEDKGQAWFVEPTKKARIFLGRPADAFMIMRDFGLGITDRDLEKIAAENEPLRNQLFAKKLAGRILLQVEDKGQAWFVDPVSLKRHFLGRPGDAFRLMKKLGLGIRTEDLNEISVARDVAAARQVKVTMLAQNNSGEAGTAELKEIGTTTKVEIEIAGAPAGVIQPAHIHTGSCAAIGGIVFPLNDVIDGKSETVLQTPFSDILSRLPLAINVHKSVPEISTSVSCGDISAAAVKVERKRIEARDDKRFEVRAEVVGSASEVTAKSEFTTASIDKAAIISEALANLRASKQTISERLRIETEDQELSSRLRAEAKTKDGMTEVKVEVRFIVNSIDPSAITDQTFNKLSALTAAEIDSVLVLETK